MSDYLLTFVASFCSSITQRQNDKANNDEKD